MTSRAIKNPHQKVLGRCAGQCRGQDTDWKVQSLEARVLWVFLTWFCSSSFETFSWYLSWASNRLVARHLTIRLDTVLQTEKFPASIANLDSWRSVLIGTSWNVYQKNAKQLPKIYFLQGRASEKKNKLCEATVVLMISFPFFHVFLLPLVLCVLHWTPDCKVNASKVPLHIALYWWINVEATPKRNTLLVDLCWF